MWWELTTCVSVCKFKLKCPSRKYIRGNWSENKPNWQIWLHTFLSAWPHCHSLSPLPYFPSSPACRKPLYSIALANRLSLWENGVFAAMVSQFFCPRIVPFDSERASRSGGTFICLRFLPTPSASVDRTREAGLEHIHSVHFGSSTHFRYDYIYCTVLW